jgi:hypothetical protein
MRLKQGKDRPIERREEYDCVGTCVVSILPWYIRATPRD